MIGKKVLLIDDDPDFLQLTCRIFENAGAQVITAYDGLEGINKLYTHRPNLIILDVMMPGEDGFEVCQRIRQIAATPLIMVTALNQEQEILRGLDAGADDFLSKPFNSEILLARARAVLRRSEQDNDHQEMPNYDDGHLKINTEKHRVLVKGKQVKLTPVEFRLLIFLLSNTGKVLSFGKILDTVWGREYKGNDNYVHVYISQLRRKIEPDSKNPCYILSVHGVGYLFEKQTYGF